MLSVFWVTGFYFQTLSESTSDTKKHTILCALMYLPVELLCNLILSFSSLLWHLQYNCIPHLLHSVCKIVVSDVQKNVRPTLYVRHRLLQSLDGSSRLVKYLLNLTALCGFELLTHSEAILACSWCIMGSWPWKFEHLKDTVLGMNYHLKILLSLI